VLEVARRPPILVLVPRPWLCDAPRGFGISGPLDAELPFERRLVDSDDRKVVIGGGLEERVVVAVAVNGPLDPADPLQARGSEVNLLEQLVLLLHGGILPKCAILGLDNHGFAVLAHVFLPRGEDWEVDGGRVGTTLLEVPVL